MLTDSFEANKKIIRKYFIQYSVSAAVGLHLKTLRDRPILDNDLWRGKERAILHPETHAGPKWRATRVQNAAVL